jgi:hypothetical protein
MESCCHCCDDTVDDACAVIPSFEHLNYFFGQLLGPEDLRAEHDYFAAKLAVMQRWTIGYGVVCGLEVTLERDDDCATRDEFDRVEVVVGAGVAVDCEGRLLVVRKPLRRKLRTLVDPRRSHGSTWDCEDEPEPQSLFVALAFTTQKHRAVRPMAQDPCAPPGGKQWARTIECTEIVVSTEPPALDICDGCCDPCLEPSVPLARLDRWTEGFGYDVDMSIRRMLGRQALTTITGISWQHGASYSPDDADRLLQDGLVVRFSRGVRVATIADGVVDLIVYEGGGGRRDNWNYRTIELAPVLPDEGDALTDELWLRYTGNDRLSTGDRVVVAVRCDFLLDGCCLAVDGNHIGGAVPWFEPAEAPDDWAEPCVVEPIDSAGAPACAPPDRPAIWRSGNGTQGGSFESWFFVGNRDEPHGEKRAR